MASTTTNRRQGLNTGAAVKVPCKAATTANITLSGEQTIDGISCTDGDRVLVMEQNTASENGIYVVSTSTWQRDKDFDGTFDVVEGTLIPVSRGTTNGGQIFRVTNTGTITIGTTSLTFTYALDAASMVFLPSGSGATDSTVREALRLFVHTSQYSNAGNFNTARDALTGSFGVYELHAASHIRALSTLRFTNDDSATSTDIKVEKVVGGSGGTQGYLQFSAVGTQSSSGAGILLVPSTSVDAVSSTINTQIMLYNKPGLDYERFGITWFGGALVFDVTALGSGSQRPMQFNIGSTVTMMLNTSGQVGIGPDCTNANVAEVLHIMRSSATEAGGFRIQNNEAGGYGNGINFYSTDSDNTTVAEAGTIAVKGEASWNGAGNRSSYMTFSTRAANTLAERLRITAGGVITTGAATITTNAAASDIVIPNNTNVRGVNNAGNDTVRMIGVSTGDQVVIAAGGNDIRWGKPLVALGGGSSATLGTIGGSGPATAGQNTWMRVCDSTGTAFWVPAWK